MLPILARSVDSIKWKLRINLCAIRWCSAVSCGNSNGDDGSNLATYLMQSFGVTKQSATKAAKKWEISKLENCIALVAFFKDQGFSDAQVCKLIKIRPMVLCLKPQSMIPKIEFLKSKIPEPCEVNRIITTYPSLLSTSLERRMIPSFNLLINLLGSERDAADAVRRAGDVLLTDPECMRNLEILKKYGVPSSKLAILIRHKFIAMKLSSTLIEESIEELRKMGFKSNSSMFVIALRVRLMVRKQSWDEKVAFFKEFGWSEEEFMIAFRRNPNVAIYSNEKIKKMINYLKELGIGPLRIVKDSEVLGLSFEKRIIPRSSVYRVLSSKGLLRGSTSLHSFFRVSENKFVEKYIDRYYEVTGLGELYQEKLQLARKAVTH